MANSILQSGFSPLMIAAQEDHLAIVELLIAAKARVNAQNCRGTTALDLAVSKGQIEIVSILLKNGADPKVMDKVNLLQINVKTYLLTCFADGKNSNGHSKNVWSLSSTKS